MRAVLLCALALSLSGCLFHRLNERLVEQGFPETQVGRLRSPVGHAAFGPDALSWGAGVQYARVSDTRWRRGAIDVEVEGPRLRVLSALAELSEEPGGWRVRVSGGGHGTGRSFFLARPQQPERAARGRVVLARLEGPGVQDRLTIEVPEAEAARGLPWPQVGLALLAGWGDHWETPREGLAQGKAGRDWEANLHVGREARVLEGLPPGE